MTTVGSDVPPSTIYSWVHLSDIHFGHGSPSWRVDQTDVVEKLLLDLQNTVANATATPPDALLITGDIAFSGKATEFDHARELISRLVQSFDPPPKVYAVGGNHDVVRTPANDLSTMRLLKELRGGGDLDASVSHEPDRRALESRFDQFVAFCRDVGSPVDVTGAWRESIEVDDARIRLIGWNTGLLCNDNQERGALAVPLASAQSSLVDPEEREIKILLTHHSLDWLQEQQRNTLRSFMWTRGTNLHLSGHEHSPDFTSAINARGQKLISLSAGATHADKDTGWAQTEHYYSVCRLVRDDDSIRLEVFPRRFSLRAREWEVDTDAVVEPPSTSFTLLESVRKSSNGNAGARARFESRLKTLGRRRTTFPTDLSTSELVRRDLAVPARDIAGGLIVDAVLASPSDSCLILGDPGSGKTILAYTLATRMLEQGLLPLVLDIRAAEADWGSRRQLLQDQVGFDIGEDEESQVVVILDGLDEALGAGLDPHEIHRRTARIQDLVPTVALCRRYEFTTRLGTWFQESFDQIMTIAQWSLDDFSEYLGRMVRGGELLDTGLEDRVRADARLATLVSRPLLARMLTLVANHGEDSLPADVPGLYAAYLTRVGDATDVALHRVAPGLDVGALDVWRHVSWAVFTEHARGVDAFAAKSVVAAAASLQMSEEAAFRAVQTIMDVDPRGDTVSFIHYSLFEFLVAQTVADELVRYAATAPDRAVRALAKDLPIEVRRYLVGILRGSTALTVHRWPRYLSDIYKSAANLEDHGSRLTVCNLVVYVLCRLGVSVEHALLDLLAQEEDPFLRNSLYWALARVDHRESAVEYVDALLRDSEFAALNRGYLLYYYGDLPEHAGPPFVDGGGPWTNTRDEVRKKMLGDDYSSVSTGRRLVDVLTFVDMAAVRDSKIAVADSNMLAVILNTIPFDETVQPAVAAIKLRLSLVGE